MRQSLTCSSPLCSSKTLKELLNRIAGANVTVIGLGLFGGGESAARYLCSKGAKVCVMDLRSSEALSPAVSRLSGLPISFKFGPHSRTDIEKSDLIVLNPAVPRDAEIVSFAAQHEIPMCSPMNIFLALCDAPIIAITGSVGKSTTTAMLAGMLAESGRRVHMGGNIGISLLPCLDDISHNDTVVLELSSVQLEDAAALEFSPYLALVTNIFPNHLDRYKSFELYAEAKRNIIKFQKADSITVLNLEDAVLSGRWAMHVRGELFFFDAGSGRENPRSTVPFEGVRLENDDIVWRRSRERKVIFAKSEFLLPGLHNLKNAMAATAAALALGAGAEDIKLALKKFKSLEHRLEHCGSVDGITFYNDSDSTTPDSTIAAIDSFPQPITLICGGKSKGVSFAGLAGAIVNKVDVLITIGESGPLIAQLVREEGARLGTSQIVMEASSFFDAVEKSYTHSMPGSTVLFSPSCSSFDMFRNFAERGREFKELVAGLRQRQSRRRATA